MAKQKLASSADNPKSTAQSNNQQAPGFFVASLRRLLRHKLAVAGLILTFAFIFLAAFGHNFAEHSITEQNLRNRFAPPTFKPTVPLGIAVDGTISITAVSNGRIFTRDLLINIPRWSLSLDEELSTPPAAGDGVIYFATVGGRLVAHETRQGRELWSRELPSAERLWNVNGNLLALTSESDLVFVDQDGNDVWQASLNEPILAEVSGEMRRPTIVTEQGNVYLMDEDGAQQTVIVLNHQPEVAFVNGDQLYVYSRSRLTAVDLNTGNVHRLSGLPTLSKSPLAMTGTDSQLAISFDDGTVLSYDLHGQAVLWDSPVEANLLGMFFHGRTLQGISRGGRHLIINPATGGVNSRRAVEGYTEVHYLGTDELGRDVFARLLAGGRVSLGLGFTVSLISVTFGTLVGAIAGYFGGWIDSLLMRVVDFMLSIPTLPLLMIFSYLLGPSFTTMVVVLVIFGWLNISRIVRSQVLSIKQQDFIQAAQALGISTPRIILRHVIPNSIGPIIVAATLQVGTAILSESQLSYLGLGIQPPTPSWGNMLMNARQYLTTAPWLAIWPGLCIFLTLLAFNFIGDGLRDAFDPKLKGRN